MLHRRFNRQLNRVDSMTGRLHVLYQLLTVPDVSSFRMLSLPSLLGIRSVRTFTGQADRESVWSGEIAGRSEKRESVGKWESQTIPQRGGWAVFDRSLPYHGKCPISDSRDGDESLFAPSIDPPFDLRGYIERNEAIVIVYDLSDQTRERIQIIC